MSERISHSYLQQRTLADFPVKDRNKGQFFEGPTDDTLIREIRLGRLVYGVTNSDRVQQVIEQHLSFTRDQLQLLERHDIRTVNPSYIITQREQINDRTGVSYPEKILSIIGDKVKDAVDFEDALASGNATYIDAYDDLAVRLVGVLEEQYAASGKIAPDLMHLAQYVIDPAATTVQNMTVLVDVEPHEDLFEGSSVDRVTAYTMGNLAQDIVDLAAAADEQPICSLGVVIAAIEAMPTFKYWEGDIKTPFLEAVRAQDRLAIAELLNID